MRQLDEYARRALWEWSQILGSIKFRRKADQVADALTDAARRVARQTPIEERRARWQ